MRHELINADLETFRDDFASLETALRGVVTGQDAVVAELVVTVLAGGHILLEGMPGLGKTNLAKALAKALGLRLARIQCTPDIMPSDITGSEVLARGEDGERQGLSFKPGPIFAPMVLVDEINRATPKTQSALLEAMQEGQVTYAGVRRALPSPFWLIATQNSIELEGTYPLPEAQLDRFFAKILVPYPDKEALVAIADRSLDLEPVDRLDSILPAERLPMMMALPREVVVSDFVKNAAADLILATHPGSDDASALARERVLYGASPRAMQCLLRAARVRALADGRGHVALDDLAASAPAVLRHRVFLTLASELEGVGVDGIIEELVREWRRKRSGTR